LKRHEEGVVREDIARQGVSRESTQKYSRTVHSVVNGDEIEMRLCAEFHESHLNHLEKINQAYI